MRVPAGICGRLDGVGRVLNLCSDAMQHNAELRQFPQIPAFITTRRWSALSPMV